MQNEYVKEYLNRFNTTKEFLEDVHAFEKCRSILENYNRVEAIAHIQYLIQRYASEINQLGFLLDGVHVIRGVDYATMSDLQIRDQLIYIGQRIPIYAFIREGEKKAADDLLNRIGCYGFGAYK